MSDNQQQPEMEQEKEPSSFTLIFSMALAGLISGMTIISVYEGTLPTITANKARELRQAVFKVLPGVDKMQRLQFKEGKLVVGGDEKADENTIYGG